MTKQTFPLPRQRRLQHRSGDRAVYSPLADDPELRTTFELTEDESVVLVEVGPRMRDRVVSSSPPSIEVFGSHGRTVAHESGRRERAAWWK